MLKLIQLSDLHVTSRTCSEYAHLGRLTDHITRHHPDAVVVITGDVTDHGRPGEWAAALDHLRRLEEGVRWLTVTLGNHDGELHGGLGFVDREPSFQGVRQLHGARPTYPIISRIDGVQLITLDSTAAASGIDDLARGHLGREQLLEVAGALEDDSPRARIVCLHHHPWYRDLGLELVDAPELLYVLAGRCDLLCFGHRHEHDVWPDRHEVGLAVAADANTRPVDGELSYELYSITDSGAITHTHATLDV